MSKIFEDAHELVHQFNTQIIGLPIPSHPVRLSDDRKAWAMSAFNEELSEFYNSATLADEADALVDLTYFALGRLVEMGIRPGPIFREVHDANMRKQRGELSKRPNSKGYDAIKPEGWKGPDIDKVLSEQYDRDELPAIIPTTIAPAPSIQHNDLLPATPKKLEPVPYAGKEDFKSARVLVMGYGRHGKDTVAEMLSKKYGLTFQSSSMFCAEKVIYPSYCRALQATRASRQKPPEGINNPEVYMWTRGGSQPVPAYSSAHMCFEDRHNFRDVWYDLISQYNRPDPSTLGNAIFEQFDIYAGLRSSTEFHALQNTGAFDVAIWVDRSHVLPPEDKSSCTVEPWMADWVIDNNNDLEQLAFNVDQLARTLGFGDLK